MLSVNIDRLKSGMMLAKPVYSLHGVLLFDKGDVLTERNIWVLKSWGVRQVWLNGGHEEEGQLTSENFLKLSIKESLEKKFSGTPDDEVMAEIMRVAGRLLEERLTKNEE